jgi:hypothetical protein
LVDAESAADVLFGSARCIAAAVLGGASAAVSELSAKAALSAVFLSSMSPRFNCGKFRSVRVDHHFC